MTEQPVILVMEAGGQAPEWIMVLPLGRVELRDGRTGFEVTAADLQTIVQKYQTEGIDLVVDYEHQTLGAGKAPAAGWIKELKAQVDGLYARVEWNQTARQHIEAGEYRYYSPVVKMNGRRPVALLHLALVNDPAIKNLPALLAAKYGGEGEAEVMILAANPADKTAQEARAKKYGISVKDGSNVTKPGQWAQVPDEQYGDPVNYRYPMPDHSQCQAAWDYWSHLDNQAQYTPAERTIITDRIKARAQAVGMQISKEAKKAMKEQLKKLLGITEEKPDAEILALAGDRLRQAASLTEIAQAAGLEATATPSQIKGAVLALKQGQDTIISLQTKVAALETAAGQAQAQAAVTEALKLRKITPAQQEWALKYAITDAEGFKVYVAQAPEVMPGDPLKQPRGTGSSEGGLAADELHICKQMGLDPKAFKATRDLESAAQ